MEDATPKRRTRRPVEVDDVSDRIVSTKKAAKVNGNGRARRSARPDQISVESKKHIQVVKTRRLTVEEKNQGEQESETLKDWEDVEVETFVTDPAYIRVNAGVTKQLRDYESLRLDVAITMPCYREGVQPTYEYVSDLVAELLSNEVTWWVEEGNA